MYHSLVGSHLHYGAQLLRGQTNTENIDKIWMLKGNPNSQAILNWIIQILHYYCRKQNKNIENLQIIEQNVVLSALLSVYCGLCFLWLPEFFQFLNTVLCKIKCHKWSFVKYIVSFSGLKLVFSKLSLAKYHFFHKKPVFTVTSIYLISCLQSTET